eukprot:364809-Chlamydomonas_euryale.AAC.28
MPVPPTVHQVNANMIIDHKIPSDECKHGHLQQHFIGCTQTWSLTIAFHQVHANTVIDHDRSNGKHGRQDKAEDSLQYIKPC